MRSICYFGFLLALGSAGAAAAQTATTDECLNTVDCARQIVRIALALRDENKALSTRIAALENPRITEFQFTEENAAQPISIPESETATFCGLSFVAEAAENTNCGVFKEGSVWKAKAREGLTTNCKAICMHPGEAK